LKKLSIVKFRETRAGRKAYAGLGKTKAELIMEGKKPTAALISERIGVDEDIVVGFLQTFISPGKKTFQLYRLQT